jgi:hypothetical protein
MPVEPELAYGALSAASDDPFERAALRRRISDRPPGGRAYSPGLESALRTGLEFAPYGVGPAMAGINAATGGSPAEAGLVSMTSSPLPIWARLLAGAGGLALEPDEAAALGGGAAKKGTSKAAEVLKRLFGKWERYTTEYPPVDPRGKLVTKLPGGKEGPVIEGLTPKQEEKAIAEGKAFRSKKLTPESEEFARDRSKVTTALKQEGFEPYFPPEQRADVNPRNYPTPYNMATMADPEKEATIAKYNELYGGPASRQRLQAGYQRGLEMPNTEDWYFMKQLEDKYIRELGETEGRKKFAQRFAGGMAATTGGQTPMANLMMQHYATHMAETGQEIPGASYLFPPPVGGRYAGSNMEQFQKYLEGGMEPFGPGNPKRHDFMYAFLGHKLPVIDEQMMGAIKPGENIPKFYSPASRVVRQEAETAGTDPREFQGVGWAGLKAGKEGPGYVYEGPMIGHPNLATERTHILTGAPREEVVRQALVRALRPLYGIGGAGLAGPMLERAGIGGEQVPQTTQ